MPTSFEPDSIEGVFWAKLVKHIDARGDLTELFRADELPSGFRPVMGYVSTTFPGVKRGPHEHRKQTCCFCFVGPSVFRIWLWDNRPASPTLGSLRVEIAEAQRPLALIVPPGVAHAYQNIGEELGTVYNFPDRLYAGEGRREQVDEIRYEDK